MNQIISRFVFILRRSRNVSYVPSLNVCSYTSTFKQMLLPTKCETTQFLRYSVPSVKPISSEKKSVRNLDDLKSYISEDRQFYLKLLINILNNINYDSTSLEDIKFLLTCCGRSVADSSKDSRNGICQEIYNKLLNCNKLDLDICHTYIEVCTDNNVILNCKEFLSRLKFEPNQNTFKLLLDNVCERGDILQAVELLELMKIKSVSVNEEMFNKLVLAHTIYGGSKSGETVIQTMRAAQIPTTAATKWSILKGVVQRKDGDDVDYVLAKYPIELNEGQVLELLETVALCGNFEWFVKVEHLLNSVIVTREFITYLRNLCIHLVHMDKSECAMSIYEKFVDPTKDNNYSFFILKEMLHLNVDTKRIIEICKHLHDTNLNILAVQNLTELALKRNYVEASWKLLENMPMLRPHFFWPLLLNANKEEGEVGVFNVLQRMVDMKVEINQDTLQLYVFPFCNTEDSKLFLKKLNKLNITTKEAVNSMLIFLLRNKKVQEAAELCNNYDVIIVGEKIFRLICSSWITSNDNESIVKVLQRYCESNHTTKIDLVGDFLTETLNSCESNDDFVRYINLLELICEKKLKTSTSTADTLQELSTKCQNPDLAEKIKDKVNMLLDFALHPEPVHIPHPRNMTLDELECHLLELQEKKMETRGVLRKLIQLHAGLGRLDRVAELRQQFLSAGYKETIGMKSSLMHTFVKENYLEEALNVYNEIKIADPKFVVDDFKIIDLATLLVKEEKYDEAMDMLRKESESKKTIGGANIERNCWQLLDSFKDADKQLEMFKFLIEKSYCKPTNIIFGPLIRIHLNRGDLEKSVKIYVNCATDYKRTPFQLEIIKSVLKEQNENLLQTVLKATRDVHGLIPTQEALIAALAENGQEKALQKVFLKNKVNVKNELKRRCQRWVQEGKVEPLRTLANACERFPQVFDVHLVYAYILQTYSLNNDHKGASEFYDQLLEKDIAIDKELELQLKKLQSSNVNTSVNNI